MTRKTSMFSLLFLLSTLSLIASFHHPRATVVTAETIDVAVIGAGPAGLAAALSLRRALGPRTSIKIYEQSSVLRDVGAHVGLLPTAFVAMNALDPTGGLSQRISSVGHVRTSLERYDAAGSLQDKIRSDPNKAEERVVVVPWHELRRVLAKEIPDADIRLGCRLESVDDGESEEGATLSFANGETCTARIVVGADGIASRVRCNIMKDVSEPVYAGSAIWRMMLSKETAESDDEFETGVSYVWGEDGRVLVVQKFGEGESTRLYISGQSSWPKDELHVLDRRYGDSGGYRPDEESDVAGEESPAFDDRGDERLGRFLREFGSYPAHLLRKTAAGCDLDSILEHPIRFRPPGAPWGVSRTTLTGDAAHGMPPNSAMGVPMAFEDAVELGRAAFEHGCSPEALRSYERVRSRRVNVIAANILKQSTSYYEDKDDGANPFKLEGNEGLIEFVTKFRQEPVPEYKGRES